MALFFLIVGQAVRRDSVAERPNFSNCILYSFVKGLNLIRLGTSSASNQIAISYCEAKHLAVAIASY